MNKQTITFTASEQTLTKTGGIEHYASNIVSYIEASFTLGDNWTGYDSIRAVWESGYARIATVLDANNKCIVPAEVLTYKSKVNVNLVGSIVENTVLTDRLTTYPILALTVDADARVDSSETTPVTASQFEQFVDVVRDEASAIQNYTYDSEAWAVGQRAGVDVPSTDETYHNNAKYYADQGATLQQEVTDLKSDLTDVTDSIADVSYPEVPREPNVSGYYINSSGELVSASSNYWVTPLVDISAYSKLYITGRANYAHLIYAFYDSSEAFIEGEPSYGGESSTQLTDQAVLVPQNAKYVRVALSYNIKPFIGIKYRSISVKGVGELQDFLDDVASTETYQTDTIESVTYESGYVNRGGSSGGGNYVHTNKIPVNKGDRLYLVFAVTGNLGDFRFVTAYDVTGNAVFASGAESTTTAGYTVPEGIASVILSISGTDTSGALYKIHIVRNISQNVIDTQSAKDLLFGKKWCVCGDSFSYGGQSVMPVFADGKYAGCRKVYPYFIGNRTHINIVDFTGNGRTLAYPSDGSFNNSLTNPSADYYYQNIPADVDYITIYLGINDSHHASGSSGSDGEDTTGVIPIGTIDDDTTATFGGAWNVVLSWLIANRPKAHIGIIVSNGVDSVAYRELTIAIAKKYGIAYIDLNGDERTPAMIRTVNPDIPQAVRTALINKWAVEVGVNTHPNTDAHEYESFFIENFLRSI